MAAISFKSGIYYAETTYTRSSASRLAVQCSEYADTDLAGQRLEPIRDRGTCLDAIQSLDATLASIYTTHVNYDLLQLTDNTAYTRCSGCFLEYVDGASPLVARFCDYDANAPEGPQQDVFYALVCVASVSPLSLIHI